MKITDQKKFTSLNNAVHWIPLRNTLDGSIVIKMTDLVAMDDTTYLVWDMQSNQVVRVERTSVAGQSQYEELPNSELQLKQ